MWIEAKKQLPKEPGMKIVFVPTLDEEKPFIQLAWFEPEGTGNMYGWQMLPEVYCKGVTHWMPLPEPPSTSPSSKPPSTSPDELCAEKLAEYSERRAEYDAMCAEYQELSSKLGRYVVHDYNILLKFDDDQTEKNSTG